jgi:membrane protease subunit HflC
MVRRWVVALLVAVIAVLVAEVCMFTVNVTDYAIVSRFGKIVGVGYQPGLHFKQPWDKVTTFDNRLLSQSYNGETFLTNDSRGLIVDFYIKWRVKDAKVFYTSFSQAASGAVNTAGQRLASTVKDGIKTVVALRTLQQIISAERSELTGEMLRQASAKAAQFGVDLVDVRIQRIDLPDEVAARVFDSMKQNFAKIAAQKRAEGQQQSAAIRASAERQRTEIIANAERDAQQVRGEGDAVASQTYARAYGKDPEFYAFWRSMQAYDRSLGKDGDLLVISPDGEFFRYLKDSGKSAAPRH